ncbi:MAG: hypothetical protein E2592_01170 [Methylobacillus sp.]|nr:hypothetical protein [Methylobacillus sp.]
MPASAACATLYTVGAGIGYDHRRENQQVVYRDSADNGSTALSALSARSANLSVTTLPTGTPDGKRRVARCDDVGGIDGAGEVRRSSACITISTIGNDATD